MPDVAEQKGRTNLSWEDVCSDPNLQDLPYKIETNDRGQIVMSPTFAYHGRLQYRIAHLMEEHQTAGKATVETAIQTSKGTKVADAAWLSTERWDEVKEAFDVPVAPEICVEVLSPTNTTEEIEEKKQLYLEAGAEEVWLCDEEGRVQFFDVDGPLETSTFVPDFPERVEI